jgi:hypothetical protein
MCAYFSENRGDSGSLGPEMWNEEALNVMRNEMSSLSKDDKFHDYLKIPIVSRALKHWTGLKRIENAEERGNLNENPEVLYVFKRFVRLNEICRRANVKCPLQDLLNRVDPENVEDAKQKRKKGADSSAVQRFMNAGKSDEENNTKKKEIDEKVSEVVRDGPIVIEEVKEEDDDDEIEVEEKIEEVEVEEEKIEEVETKEEKIEEVERVIEEVKHVNDMSVKELKALIRSANLKWNDCREKSELRERAREAQEKLKNGDIEEKVPEVPDDFMREDSTKVDDSHWETKSDSGESTEGPQQEQPQQEQENDFDQYLPPRFRRKKMPFSQWWRRQLKIAVFQFLGIFVMMLISSMLGYGPLWEPEEVMEQTSPAVVEDVLDDEISFDNYANEL